MPSGGLRVTFLESAMVSGGEAMPFPSTFPSCDRGQVADVVVSVDHYRAPKLQSPEFHLVRRS